MKGEWTLDFARRWWPFFTTPSFFRLLRAHRDQARSGIATARTLTIETRARKRIRFTIRVAGSDLRCIEEVFKEHVYGRAVNIRRCRTAIDLGANIGVASRYIASIYPECSILAVEPFPSNAQLLRLNLKDLIDSGKCQVLEAAVWGKDHCRLNVAVPEADYNAFQFEEQRDVSDLEKHVSVPGVTMAEVLEKSRFSDVDLLKVDIEGAEVQLFSGNVDWLRRINTIAIEFHGRSRETSGFDRLMQEQGFSVSEDDSHTVIACRLRDAT